MLLCKLQPDHKMFSLNSVCITAELLSLTRHTQKKYILRHWAYVSGDFVNTRKYIWNVILNAYPYF